MSLNAFSPSFPASPADEQYYDRQRHQRYFDHDHDHDLDDSGYPHRHQRQRSLEYEHEHVRQHSPSHTARHKPSLANINVPSFGAFRSQLPSALSASQAPYAAFHHTVSRHISLPTAERPSPPLAHQASRPQSLASGPSTLHDGLYATPEQPEHRSYSATPAAHERHVSIDSRIGSTIPSSASTSPQRQMINTTVKHAHERIDHHTAPSSTSSIDPSEQYSPLPPESPSSMIASQQAPTMTLQFDGIQRTLSDESLGTASNGSAKRSKSPAGRLGSFFAWKTPLKSDGDESPTTTFSDRSMSPLPSPQVRTLPISMDGDRLPARLTPPGLDVQKANSNGAYFTNPETPLLLGDNASNAHVRELERELSHISQELAGSIRREMELEDELDRLRNEMPMFPPSDISHRRSSDYFSDSGASSTKFPITDVDAKLDQMEKQLRKVEQERANLKVETASRLQIELSRRRDLEELVQTLEDQLEKCNRQAGAGPGGLEGKVEELESTLDETKRRLGQEKMTKENFEDLYSATREELEKHRNEADNLRNEVVPQLKARVEGLEAEASDTQALVYENTRLQQELTALRGGNHSRFNSIAEDGVASAVRMNLSRTGSLARSSSLRRGGSVNQKEAGRQRSGSNGITSADGVKEIEEQRDALHKALKLLIKRYEKQTRDHERAMKKMTKATDQAEQVTPKRTAYTREVAFLKEEVSTLRKRTEDALEQKWQYEKNLSGLKMDLDRAEQETRGLRVILQENDIGAGTERGVSGGEEDEELKLSISRAETERDHARQVAEQYRRQAQSAGGNSSAELMNSAKRMEELAEQLERQVQANNQLRERLTTAITKGEHEQKESTRQIEEMQRRLAGMEDSVLAAQQHSETTLANHDAEVRQIENASSPQLSRLRISIPEPGRLSPASPLLKRSPRLGSKKLSDSSLLEVSRTQMLERKVKELEGLLREAEEDMQTVVQRVNTSQMEVADLQTERDAALIQMRKLQAQIEQERKKADAMMR